MTTDGLPVASQCVIFATPTLDHRVSLEFFRSMLQSTWLLNSNNIAYGFLQVAGDQFIAKARNRLVTEFLLDYPMATDLFFLDDDIGWPPEKVLEFLRRPEAIVAGTYPKKTPTPEYAVELELVDGELKEQGGLYRAISAPTGFMRIKRGVLEAMVKEAVVYREPDLDGKDRERFNVFQAGVHPGEGRFWGEDYCFCQNWRAMGGEIWIDPNIAFTHRGNKCWEGNFQDTLSGWLAAHAEKEAAE